MSMNWKKIQGVLPLKRDFEPKDLNRVKYTREARNNFDGTTEKTQVSFPIYPVDGTPFCLVYCMQQYDTGTRMMHWANNGPKLFETFPTILEDSQPWDLARSRQETVEAFHQSMATFLRQFFSLNAWDNHIKFLRNLKKPSMMNPQQFLTNLQLHNMILSSLPGVPINGTLTN